MALFTGGMDAHYALGLLSGLISKPISIDVIGNDEMKDEDIMHSNNVAYHNLRGNQNPNSSAIAKAVRVLKYYIRLVMYSAKTDANVFHILWLNKFIYFDRTLLNVYYKALGKKLIFTAHNVNAGERDGMDGMMNRLSLRFLYRIVDHIFVHTERMKEQLIVDFGIKEKKVTVIPFGINNVIPRTTISRSDAREKLRLQNTERIILFFGNIAPYKGLDTLIKACRALKKKSKSPRLIIAGKVKDQKWADYWNQIERMIKEYDLESDIFAKIEYIPDENVELYYKASDVLILPYRHIYQSGVLFLSYSFGLPVIAADVGSLKEEIIEGSTGFTYARENAEELASKIDDYFDSNLYKNLEASRRKIIDYANERYSWHRIGDVTHSVYSRMR